MNGIWFDDSMFADDPEDGAPTPAVERPVAKARPRTIALGWDVFPSGNLCTRFHPSFEASGALPARTACACPRADVLGLRRSRDHDRPHARPPSQLQGVAHPALDVGDGLPHHQRLDRDGVAAGLRCGGDPLPLRPLDHGADARVLHRLRGPHGSDLRHVRSHRQAARAFFLVPPPILLHSPTWSSPLAHQRVLERSSTTTSTVSPASRADQRNPAVRPRCWDSARQGEAPVAASPARARERRPARDLRRFPFADAPKDEGRISCTAGPGLADARVSDRQSLTNGRGPLLRVGAAHGRDPELMQSTSLRCPRQLAPNSAIRPTLPSARFADRRLCADRRRERVYLTDPQSAVSPSGPARIPAQLTLTRPATRPSLISTPSWVERMVPVPHLPCQPWHSPARLSSRRPSGMSGELPLTSRMFAVPRVGAPTPSRDDCSCFSARRRVTDQLLTRSSMVTRPAWFVLSRDGSWCADAASRGGPRRRDCLVDA